MTFNGHPRRHRRAAEAGSARGVPRPGTRPQPATGTAPTLTTSTVELERPTKPDETSAGFLTRYDWLVRLANFGELLLACLTLIFIRNQSAKTNAPPVEVEEFPHSLEIENRTPMKRENFTTKKEITKKHASFNSEGLKRR